MKGNYIAAYIGMSGGGGSSPTGFEASIGFAFGEMLATSASVDKP